MFLSGSVYRKVVHSLYLLMRIDSAEDRALLMEFELDYGIADAHIQSLPSQSWSIYSTYQQDIGRCRWHPCKSEFIYLTYLIAKVILRHCILFSAIF